MDDHVGFGGQKSTASRSRMSPCWYVVFVQPCDAGSNGRRAIPTIRPHHGVLLQRGHRRDPELARWSSVSHSKSDKRTRKALAEQFSSYGQIVVEVPFDSHLRPGGVIDGTAHMDPATRRRFVEIAAALAEQFPTDTSG